MTAQALIFTHVADRENLHDPDQLEAFVERRKPFFEACLRCRNVGIVFIYSSYGVESFVQALKTSSRPQLPLNVLETEQHVYDGIQLAIDEAMKTTTVARVPKFVVIGVRELASHLLRLQRMDKRLVSSLATGAGTFTYDSPKYVEAILRLARTQWNLPNDPIVRVDIDVEVNEQALQRLLDEADRCARRVNPYWWFSGCYSGNGADDPVNVHAVRQHWLVTKKPGTKNEYELPEKAKSFLVDLAELGATQFVPDPPDDPAKDTRLSSAASKVIDRRGGSKNRRKPQVISGAGLIASAAAIRRLPPFMNAPQMVVWIDDHLKRRLHEAIHDIKADAVERIDDAAMKQDRFPNGIPRDVERTREYFRRLLNGALFDAAIEVRPFTEAVYGIVEAKATPSAEAIEPYIENAVRDRFDDAMDIWRNADYGNDLLRGWALGLTDADKRTFVDGTVAACIDYLTLCALWPQHVRAIADLLRQDAYWLFTEPRREEPEPAPSVDALVAATEAMKAATEAMLTIRRQADEPRPGNARETETFRRDASS
ncbi:MAG TPA: hypothetical protein VF266_22755 [Thermoanaerobaculia bacterium]